jgi:hypothetical protein
MNLRCGSPSFPVVEPRLIRLFTELHTPFALR